MITTQTVKTNSHYITSTTTDKYELNKPDQMYAQLVDATHGDEYYIPMHGKMQPGISNINDVSLSEGPGISLNVGPSLGYGASICYESGVNIGTENWKQTEPSRAWHVRKVFFPKSRKNQLLTALLHKLNSRIRTEVADFFDGIKDLTPLHTVENIITQIISLGFQDIEIEPTVEKSVIFKMQASENSKIYFEYYFNLNDPNMDCDIEDEVVINVVRDKKIMANWAGSIFNSFFILEKWV